MGQKIHPNGFRVGITRDWNSKWYARKKEFGDLLFEDYQIREMIKKEYTFAGIPRIQIERKGEGAATYYEILLSVTWNGVQGMRTISSMHYLANVGDQA